jgi:hypothetical protein
MMLRGGKSVTDKLTTLLTMPEGQFSVESITDPDGAPSNALDLDLGFVISGKVTLPNLVEGTGTVCVYADQRGGPFNGSIGCTTLAFTRATAPAEPGTTDYSWTVTFPPDSNVIPAPQGPATQLYRLTAVFVLDDPMMDVRGAVDIGSYMVI